VRQGKLAMVVEQPLFVTKLLYRLKYNICRQLCEELLDFETRWGSALNTYLLNKGVRF